MRVAAADAATRVGFAFDLDDGQHDHCEHHSTRYHCVTSHHHRTVCGVVDLSTAAAGRRRQSRMFLLRRLAGDVVRGRHRGVVFP